MVVEMVVAERRGATVFFPQTWEKVSVRPVSPHEIQDGRTYLVTADCEGEVYEPVGEQELPPGFWGFEGSTNSPEELAINLFDAGVIKFDFEKGWRLKLHETHPEAPLSPFYIDLRKLQSNLGAKQQAVAALVKLAKDLDYEYVAGIPLAAVALASSVADQTGKPQITPRLEKKTHGNVQLIDGVYRPGGVALVVDDLVTSADSKLEAIQVLEGSGLVVRDVVVVFDREQGGAEQLAARGYTLHAALKIRPTLEFYERIGRITATQLERVLNYLAAPLGKN